MDDPRPVLRAAWIIAGGAASPPALVAEARGASAPTTPSATRRPSRAAWAWGRRSRPPDERGAAHRRPAPTGVEVRVADEDGPTGRRRRGRRAAAALPRGHGRLLERPRGHRRGAHGRRVAAHRRPGPPRRRGMRRAGRPSDRHVHPRRLQRASRPRWRPCSAATRGWPTSPSWPAPDEVMGEVGVAVVVPSDPARPPDARGPAGARGGRSGPPQAARATWCWWTDLPLTTAAKVDRRRLGRRGWSSSRPRRRRRRTGDGCRHDRRPGRTRGSCSAGSRPCRCTATRSSGP